MQAFYIPKVFSNGIMEFDDSKIVHFQKNVNFDDTKVQEG